jgi:N-acetylglutamate synthase-like GNAT family acetyltransferase
VDQPGGYRLRPATESDVPSVAGLVKAAYGHYVERIGMLPRPMTDDYPEVIRDRQVTVAEQDGAIVGVVVLTVTDEGFWSTTSRSIPPVAGPGSVGRCCSSRRRRRGGRGLTPSTSTPTSR